MWSFTITIAFLLTVTSSHGGVHRRDERKELSGLAKNTISKCERILRRLEETAAGKREMDSGMRSILRDMRALLRFSEEELETAKDAISTKSTKSLLSDSGRVLKEAMEMELIIQWGDAVHAVNTDVYPEGLEDQDHFEEIKAIIEDGHVEEIYDAFNHLKDAAQNYESSLAETINGQSTELSELAKQTTAKSERFLEKFEETVDGEGGLDRGMKSILRDMRALLRSSEKKLNTARDTIPTLITRSLQSNIGGLLNEALELELIIRWRDVINLVKYDVFQGNLKDRTEEEDQDLFEEIEELMEDGDVEEIYEYLTLLKDTAQKYELLPDMYFKLYDIVFS